MINRHVSYLVFFKILIASLILYIFTSILGWDMFKYPDFNSIYSECSRNYYSNILYGELFCSLNSISEYTNISKTTIYEHFNSSFNVFLSEVILHVWKKIRKIYYGKTNDDPISNILLIFRTWHEFNFENLLLARNIYASYILFVDTEYFPITNVLTDIEDELSKLNFNDEDIKEIIRIFYISVDEILGNPDVRNIDNVMKDIELFLNNKKN